MSARLGLFALAPLLATSTAYAQAPGEIEPSYAQPPPTEVTPVVVVDTGVPVMQHRFAVGLNLGGFSVRPSENEDASDTEFRAAEYVLPAIRPAVRPAVSPRGPACSTRR
jgi:hypothetical protein